MPEFEGKPVVGCPIPPCVEYPSGNREWQRRNCVTQPGYEMPRPRILQVPANKRGGLGKKPNPANKPWAEARIWRAEAENAVKAGVAPPEVAQASLWAVRNGARTQWGGPEEMTRTPRGAPARRPTQSSERVSGRRAEGQSPGGRTHFRPPERGEE